MNNGHNHTKNTAKTIVSNLVFQVSTLLLSFVSRNVFIIELGDAYLGVNGLFSSILGLLSLAELGVGAAITYSLYRPAKDNDYARLASLMVFYKRCYQVVGIAIAGIGILIIPFIPYMVNFETDLDINLYLVYVLFLINSVISYWLMGYRQSIFVAMQTVYKMAVLQTVLKLIGTLINIAILIIFKNYYVYLLTMIAITAATNLSIGLFAGKKYPFLRLKKVAVINKSEKKEIYKNVYAICVWKVGNTLVTSTDNILISVICGTVIVGYYSNYSLICMSLTSFYCIVLNSLIPALGNINAQSELAFKIKTLQNLHFLNYWLLTFCSVCLMVLLGPFIKVWVGGIDKNYVLNGYIPVIIGINFWLTFIMSIVNQFKDTLGLFRRGKYSQLVMGVTNLVLSVVLGQKYGLEGILAATGISQFLFGFLLQPYYVYTYGFSQTVVPFIVATLKKMLLFIVIYIVTACICQFIREDGVISLIWKSLVCIIVTNTMLFIVFRNTEEMRYGVALIKNLMNREGEKYNV